jgi:hypothetical protein
MKMLYTGVPGGLAVWLIRTQGCLSLVTVLSQWSATTTSRGETRWVRSSRLVPMEKLELGDLLRCAG